MSSLGYKAAIIVYHTQKTLKFLYRCWLCRLLDCLDALLERGNTVFVDAISQEVETSLAEDAFFPIHDQSVVGEDFENLVQVLEMLLLVFRCHQNIVNVDENMWEVSEDLVHQTLKILSRVF